MKIVNCVVCQKKISTKLDDYYKVELHAKEVKTGTAYAHVSCYHEKNNNEMKMFEVAKELLGEVKEAVKSTQVPEVIV